MHAPLLAAFMLAWSIPRVMASESIDGSVLMHQLDHCSRSCLSSIDNPPANIEAYCNAIKTMESQSLAAIESCMQTCDIKMPHNLISICTSNSNYKSTHLNIVTSRRDGSSMMASLVNSTYATFQPCTKRCIKKYASVRPPITLPQIEKLCKTAVSETATMAKLSACVHTCKNSDSLVVDNIPFFCESYDQTQMRENALRGRAEVKQILPTDSVIFSLGTLVVNVTEKVNALAPEARTCVNKALEQVHETLPLLAGKMYSICKQVDIGPLSDCLQDCIDRGVAPADTDFTVFWKPVCAPYKKPLASSLSGSSSAGTPPSSSGSNSNQDASESSGSDSFDMSDPASFDPSKAIPLDPNQNAASNPAEASIGPSFTVSSGSGPCFKALSLGALLVMAVL
ncbi:hypothetical protein BJ741DRAFT_627557 [Chytriomyces cf. hyalinus JEL632]|nr:hypothetical protein BJ741DRAFT_627557 [Chytriomyces cf. hyalinus JEL632]